jgi:homopolymeric O-antigen transport system permease protein
VATTAQGPPKQGRPPPPSLVGGVTQGVREVYRGRDLLANLVRRDLKVRHRGTFLGMLWSLTTPLLIVGLYYFVFTFIMRALPVEDLRRPDGHSAPFAVYFFCGLALWNFFSSSVGASTGSITGASYLLNKVYFPRAILPLSAVGSALVTFGFEAAILLVAVVVFVGLPSPYLLWAPLIVAVVAAFAVGLSLILSTITVFLRDTAHFVGVFMQLWFWGTPIIYSLKFVSQRPGLVRLLELNPLTGAVVSFRNVVLLNRPPDYSLLAYSTVVAVVVLAVGASVFQRWQRVFSEIV